MENITGMFKGLDAVLKIWTDNAVTKDISPHVKSEF